MLASLWTGSGHSWASVLFLTPPVSCLEGIVEELLTDLGHHVRGVSACRGDGHKDQGHGDGFTQLVLGSRLREHLAPFRLDWQTLEA